MLDQRVCIFSNVYLFIYLALCTFESSFSIFLILLSCIRLKCPSGYRCTKHYVFCPQGGRHSAHIWGFFTVKALDGSQIVTRDTMSSVWMCFCWLCCVLVLLLKNHNTSWNQMHSRTPQCPKLHISTTQWQGGVETQEDPVISCKDLVITSSVSSYLGNFLNSIVP